jgi:carbamoylphosphate synthase large subunit
LDIVTFSEARESFEKEGVRFLLSPNETIDLAMDKLATFNFLRSARFADACIDYMY